jgi:hypothetical protein
MAKDKTPNRTLSVAISQACSAKDCDSHGTVSKTKDGIVRRYCIEHLNPAQDASTDYMLKFLNLV